MAAERGVLPGAAVEVAGLQSDGFPASWSSAVVVKIFDAGTIIPHCVVAYDDFVDTTGEKLVETFPVRSRRLRPKPPEGVQLPNISDYEVGQAVDLRENDIWWKGVAWVHTDDGRLKVFLPEVDRAMKFGDKPSCLRLSMEFEAGAWVPRPPPAKAKKLQASALAKSATKKRANAEVAAEAAATASAAVTAAAEAATLAAAGFVATVPQNPIAAANGGHPLSAPSASRQMQYKPPESSSVPQTAPKQGVAAQIDPLASQEEAASGQASRSSADGKTQTPSDGAQSDVSSDDEAEAAEIKAEEEAAAAEEPAKPTATGIMPDAPLNEPVDAQGGTKSHPDQGSMRPEAADAVKTEAGPMAPAAAVAVAPVDCHAGLVRRTARTAKSRLMTVDGHQVLKVNNYDLQTGERSVFDQELDRNGKAAQGVLGAPEVGDGRGGWVKAPSNRGYRSRLGGGRGSRGPVTVSPMEQARKAHNEAVRTDAKENVYRRALFFLGHLPVLQPFITPAVAAKISALAAEVPEDDERPPPVEFQPEGITGGEMREYQLAGLRWLVARWDDGVNAILADEMGLGKTLQTISFLSYLKRERNVKGPSLVVVPLSVVSSWCNELARWAPDLRVVRFHTNDVGERKRLRQEVLSDPTKFDVAVTTYDMMLSARLGSALSKSITWRVLVLDEGHKIKNETTAISHAMRHVARQHVVLLTGTPMQNNLHELYALLSFLHPDIFTDSHPFDNAFDLVHHKVDREVLENAHHLLRPLCIRRLKEEVETTLPPRVETRITCPLSAMQTFWYRRLLLKDSRMLASIEAQNADVEYEKDNNAWKKLQMLIMQLRKCCNHPYLFPGAEPMFDGTTTGEDVVEAAGKMGVLDRLLDRLSERGHRVTLFSQSNRMLDIIEDYLLMRGYRYARLDGSTNRVQRMIDIARFQAPNSNTFIYILNTRAGGLGVNLHTADTCILFDSDWNPQWDLQAMARVHRIGQSRVVHVYRFCTAGTVEERVQLRAEKKLFLDQMVNRGAVTRAEEVAQLSKKELLSMLRFGADRIFAAAEGRPPSDEELDAIIDRSPKKPEDDVAQTAPSGDVASDSASEKPQPENGQPSPDAKSTTAATSNGKPSGAAPDGAVVDTLKHTAAEFDAEAAPLSSFMLNGQDYSKERSLRDIAAEFWVGTKTSRQRKQRLITIDGHQVLRENNYDLATGEPSVFDSEAVRSEGVKPRFGRQIAGTDFEHSSTCQICWDGGNLVCCSECPAAYHPECMGVSLQELHGVKRWGCPHHSCSVCHRKTAAAGGLLFRCEVCPTAFCEDHLPGAAQLTVHCERFQALGQAQPKQACFVLCSSQCKELHARIPPELLSPSTGEQTHTPPAKAKAANSSVAKKAAAAAADLIAAREAEAIVDAAEGTTAVQTNGKRARKPSALKQAATQDGAEVANPPAKRRKSTAAVTASQASTAGAGSASSSRSRATRAPPRRPSAAAVAAQSTPKVKAEVPPLPTPRGRTTATAAAAIAAAEARAAALTPQQAAPPLPPRGSSLADRARALLQASPAAAAGEPPPVSAADANVTTAAAVAAFAAAPLLEDSRRSPFIGDMEARLEGAVLAALDATAVDPALGRAVVSVMRLRAHLSALPSPELHDFASSQADEGRDQLTAAIIRLSAVGPAVSWRSHQKTAVQGPRAARQ